MDPQNYALVQRPAVFSWEASTILLNTDQQSGVIPVQFPRPVVVLGAYPAVSVQGGLNTLDIPTLDDIWVKIEQDTGLEKRLTSRFDSVRTNGNGSLPNVTLGSYKDSVGGARVMNWEIGSDGSRPEIEIQFEWKRSVVGGPWYRSVFVSLTLLCNYR